MQFELVGSLLRYRLLFSHTEFDSQTWLYGDPDKPLSHLTECFVQYCIPGIDWYTESVGRAYCSAYDQFNKEVGRRLALERAVPETWSRENRGRAFRAYYGRKQ
jgi:hypothetical protein